MSDMQQEPMSEARLKEIATLCVQVENWRRMKDIRALTGLCNELALEVRRLQGQLEAADMLYDIAAYMNWHIAMASNMPLVDAIKAYEAARKGVEGDSNE